MKERTRQSLVSSDIWFRLLYMLLFAIAFGIARFILGFLVIFQFFTVLFTREVNEPLLQFGKNLSIYVYEILEFQTFNTELHPFPFSPWPDEEPGGEEWLGDTDSGGDADAEEDGADDPVEDSADKDKQ
ncbi:MAG: DUF4389 domain-containing protein [Proteobacteria bacterium]|nr:DUF4389 domain-containing protein [Pseudomonadota bacterium]